MYREKLSNLKCTKSMARGYAQTCTDVLQHLQTFLKYFYDSTTNKIQMHTYLKVLYICRNPTKKVMLDYIRNKRSNKIIFFLDNKCCVDTFHCYLQVTCYKFRKVSTIFSFIKKCQQRNHFCGLLNFFFQIEYRI